MKVTLMAILTAQVTSLSWINDIQVKTADGFFEIVDIQSKGQALYAVGNRRDLTAAVQEYSDLQVLTTSSISSKDDSKQGLEIIATSMSVDKLTGNIFLGGYSDFLGRDGNADFMMACLDQTGTVLWYHNFGTGQDDLINGVAVSGDGYVYFAGTVGGTLAGIKFKGGTDIILFKYTVNGTKVWSESFGGEGIEMAWSVTMGKTSNDIYVAGFTGFTNGFIAKYLSDGTLAWHETLTQTSSFSAVLYDHKTDEVYVTGYMFGIIDGKPTNLVDTVVLKWNSSGSRQLWSVIIGGSDIEFGFDLIIHPQTRIMYVVGTTYGSIDDKQVSAGGMDAVISKVYLNGTVAWNIQGGTPKEDVIGGITVTDDGVVHICGIWDKDYGFVGQFSDVDVSGQQNIQQVVTGSPVVAIVLILVSVLLVGSYAYYKYGERPFQYALGRRIRLEMPWSSSRRIRLGDVYDIDSPDDNLIIERKSVPQEGENV